MEHPPVAESSRSSSNRRQSMRIKQEPSSPEPNAFPPIAVPTTSVKLEPVDQHNQDENEDEDSVMGEGEFVVERILAKEKLFNKAGQESGDGFLVRWMGYGPEHDTWEPRIGLEEGSGEMIRQFESEEHPIRITVLGRTGIINPSYHVRFCGEEGTDDYSPHAVTEWRTSAQLAKSGVSKEDIKRAVRDWETKQIPTPPASDSLSLGSTTKKLLNKIKQKKTKMSAIKTKPKTKTKPKPVIKEPELDAQGSSHRRYLSRQLVEVLDMRQSKSKSNQNQLRTRFLVRHKLINRVRRQEGVQTRVEWYTASHLQNVFTGNTLREKIRQFMPSILVDEKQAETAPAVEDNEYEQERQRRMKENADLMKELGLST